MSCYSTEYRVTLETAMQEIRVVMESHGPELERLAESFRIARAAHVTDRDRIWLGGFIQGLAGVVG